MKKIKSFMLLLPEKNAKHLSLCVSLNKNPKYKHYIRAYSPV